nr:hypothetical protein [uncultured Gellertiella sp.]
MRLAILLAGALFATSASAAGGACALKSIANCATMNDLIRAKGFKPALQSFLGSRKVGWLGQKHSLTDVVEEVLGGAPDDTVVVSAGLRRFSASRYQSAMERGSVFVSDSGGIKAAGVLHFNCTRACENTYTLSILLGRKDDALAGQVRQWADEQMQHNKEAGFDAETTLIARVELLETRP